MWKRVGGFALIVFVMPYDFSCVLWLSITVSWGGLLCVIVALCDCWPLYIQIILIYFFVSRSVGSNLGPTVAKVIGR